MNIFNILKTEKKMGDLIDSWAGGMSLASEDDLYSLINEYAGWVYVCADKNAKTISKQKLRLYGIKPKGSKFIGNHRQLTHRENHYVRDTYRMDINARAGASGEADIVEITSHPVLDLIRGVNNFYTYSNFLYLTSLFLDLSGDSYWPIVLNPFRKPASMFYLPSQDIEIIPSTTKFIEGYEYRPTGAIYKNVINFKLMSPESFPQALYGKSPLSAVTSAVNISNSGRTYEQSVLNNAGILAGYFTTDQNVQEAAFNRLNKKLETYRGKGNAGKTPLFTNGLKYEARAINPKDLFGAVIGQKSKEEIAAAFGVPLSKLGVENVNKANGSNGSRDYEADTILPRLRIIEDKLNEVLLPQFDSALFCAFDNPVKEDNEEVRLRDETDKKWGNVTTDEIRARQGLAPIAGGDKLLIPANYIPIDKVDEYWENIIQKQGAGGENANR